MVKDNGIILLTIYRGEIMDRYEYKVKLDEIKEMLAQDNVEEAAAIADTVNWRKVRAVSALCMAGDVYERAERYEDSKDVLLKIKNQQISALQKRIKELEADTGYKEKYLEAQEKINNLIITPQG